ncbi:alpha/beta hydrolase [Paractinoplanes maris]|uniref:alpha/beta hydrolase n=1 Tax=Paractinoplanes maris TaxID=1734446 RepID=UPI00202103D2|nr:alpha/beta fold hydrolase [Actinoplanes maris]
MNPVVFLHGLWIHSDSWQPWRELFAGRGHETFAPGWPGDRETVAATRADPTGLNGVGVEDITDAYAKVLAAMDRPPILIGHSFGGLIVQKLLSRGLGAAGVAISPAPVKGVRAVPFSLLRSAFPVLSRPGNKHRTVALTEKQFAYSFGNTLTADESAELHRRVTIPGPGRPLFEVSTAAFTRDAASTVDTARADRGPLLMIANGRDHTVPEVVVRGAHRLYAGSRARTDLVTFPDRGHSAPLDHGWRELADTTLSWIGAHTA